MLNMNPETIELNGKHRHQNFTLLENSLKTNPWPFETYIFSTLFAEQCGRGDVQYLSSAVSTFVFVLFVQNSVFPTNMVDI